MNKTSRISLIVLLLFMPLFGSGCTAWIYGPDTPPQDPRFYRADYNKVWQIAVDILDSEGYEILQMDRANGYISTAYKTSGPWRDKISLKIMKFEDSVRVSIISSEQHKGGPKGEYGWGNSYRSGGLEDYILSQIGWSLSAK